MPTRSKTLRRAASTASNGDARSRLERLLRSSGLGAPPTRRLYPRRDDVIAGGRPVTLLLRPTTPLLGRPVGSKRQ